MAILSFIYVLCLFYEMTYSLKAIQSNPSPSSKFGSSMSLNIDKILDSQLKNKSIELTTEMAVEEVSMIDLNTESNSVTYDNTTDDFTDSTLNSTDATETTLEGMDTTPFSIDFNRGSKTYPKTKASGPSAILTSTCSCDLTKSICDVNCCCDKDCMDHHREVFAKCIDVIANNERDETLLQHCHAKDTFFYKNNTQWLLHKENTSPASHLFCVIKDNLPPKLMNREPKVITSIEEMDRVSANHYQWNHQQTPSEVITFDGSKPYSYGDHVWMLNNSTLKPLELPTSTLNAYCTSTVKMKFMVDYRTKCNAMLEKDIDSLLYYRLYNHIEDVYIVSSPHLFNLTWINSVQDCPQNICIPITSYLCNDTHCSLINETDEITPTKHIITSLKIYLYSNGTAGYTNASVFFGVLDLDVDASKYVELEFEVHQSFVGKNKTDLTQELGGNPGYQNGRPVIVSTVIEGNETEPSSFDFFSKFTLFPLKNILAYPKNKHGFCVLSNVTYNEIKFGENIYFTCRNVHSILDATKYGNATRLCEKIQSDFYKTFANHAMDNVYIAKIGNPSQSFNDWVRMLYDHTNNNFKGTFNNDEHSAVSCANIALQIEYVFAYSVVEQLNVPRQLYITGAEIKYITEDIVFNIDNGRVTSNCRMNIKFVDTTKPKPLQYARGPHFHIQLPHDFFYPFAFNAAISFGYRLRLLNHFLMSIMFLYNQ